MILYSIYREQFNMKYTYKYAVEWGSNFKLYIFDVTVASDFESDVNQFGGFLHRLAFPVFIYSFLWQIFSLTAHRFYEEHLSYLKGIVKWQGRGGVSGMNRTVRTSHTIACDF